MSIERLDTHYCGQRVQHNIEKIKNDKRIILVNKKKLLDFIAFLQSKDLKQSTLSKDTYALWFSAKNKIKKAQVLCYNRWSDWQIRSLKPN